MSIINISQLDKAAVLAALWNASKQQGMGLLHTSGAAGVDMTVEQARQIINEDKAEGRPLYYDYLEGRVMKIDLSKDEIEPRLYDRDNGNGAAWRAISSLQK